MEIAVVLIALFSLSLQSVAAEPRGTTNWPVLRFNFTLKRSSMKVYDQSDFSMYAYPKVLGDSGSVLYDVLATFTEDTTQFNYTLVGGVAYSSSSLVPSETPSVECLDSESSRLPPINDIVKGINDAVLVSSSEDSAIECPGGKLFQATVSSNEFALCALNSSGFTMQGSDMDIRVEFLDSHIGFEGPAMKSKIDHKCKKVAWPSSVTSLGQALLTGQPISDGRTLKAAFDFSFKGISSCSCQSTPRPCIFIHGMGVEEEMPTNLDNFTDYWGDDIADNAPCCSSMKFTHLNTVNNTWTSAAQQQKVCDRVLAVSKTSADSIITDTIVVTHSMGNLMLAGAIANERCTLDSSSTWVGLAGPMRGSMASDFVQKSCAGDSNVVWEKIGNVTGRCPASTALKSLAYEGGNYSSRAMNAAYKAAQEVYQENVYALMCSKGYSGLVSMHQTEFWALGTVVPHKSSKNDGMVESQSCAAGFPESTFGKSWRDRFYMTNLNHYDMEFMSGDSILDGQKMPVKWFECLL